MRQESRHAVEVEARVVEAHAAAIEKKRLAKARATTWGNSGGGGGDGGGTFAQWIDAANPALTLELMKIRAMVDERWAALAVTNGGAAPTLRLIPAAQTSAATTVYPQPTTQGRRARFWCESRRHGPSSGAW